VVSLRRAGQPLRAASDDLQGLPGPDHEAAERTRQAGLEAAAPGPAVKSIDDGITLRVAGPVRELAGAVDRVEKAVDRLEKTMDHKLDPLDNKLDQLANKLDRLGNKLDQLGNKLDRLGENLTSLKSAGAVAVAALLVVLVGISSPDVWREGLYGQLLMQVLPGAK
jgi:outer membrane murein-binding lipoprotein Lpp